MKDFISWNLIDECVTDIADHLILSDIKFFSSFKEIFT